MTHQIFHLKYRILIAAGFELLLSCAFAQDLDPRAYVRLPEKTNTLITGFSYSYGGVVTDPTLPIQDLKADVQAVSLGYAHTFNLLGLTSQVLVALPYSWAQVSGKVVGQPESIKRSGFADTRLRLSVLVHGAPSVGLQDFLKAPRETIVGVSVSVVAPTGEFFPDKLINLGTNRWSFRPELAISHPLGRRWLMDVYSGIWFFTNNDSFYPGTSLRTQKPMGTFQAHLSYNLTPRHWVAFNATYYVGGTSSVNDLYNDDRQSNVRVGVTGVVPVGKRNSLKLAASTGAVVRIGQDFTSLSIGWSRSWFGKGEASASTSE
ncbi:MAG: transporter [Cyclobacteriaceae bacterium]|nr:transporter [Cyclobacteriaceae bacterium]